MTDSRKVIAIIADMAQVIEDQKDYLTELDRPIGDCDHGINMARGFAAVTDKLPGLADRDIGTILKTVGMTLVSTVGGASGPLYGSAFMKAGMALHGKTEIDISDFLSALKAAAGAVSQRGHSEAGEATMLDAMLPSIEAMEKEAAAGASSDAILRAGVRAAWEGAEHTKELVATKGRASYVGERGLGHQDPGATSYAFILEAIAGR